MARGTVTDAVDVLAARRAARSRAGAPAEQFGDDVGIDRRAAAAGRKLAAAEIEMEIAEVRPFAGMPARAPAEAFELRRARLAFGVDFAAVVGGALLGVAENLVGGPDFREPILRPRLLALVGMVFLGELAIGRFDFAGAGRFGQPKNFIGVAHDEPRIARPPRRRGRQCLRAYLGRGRFSRK